MRDFRSALGQARVLTKEEQLREFRDPFQFAGWDDVTAAAVIMPETVEEVQEVVGITGRHGVPAKRIQGGVPNLDSMDLASVQYSFNHHAYRRCCATIKDAGDSQGVLSPGKQRIRPAAMRSDRSEA